MSILGAVDSGSRKSRRWLDYAIKCHDDGLTLWRFEETVREREGDKAREREDKVWEKLALDVEVSKERTRSEDVSLTCSS